MSAELKGHWRKVSDRWLVRVEGDRLDGDPIVLVGKSDGTSAAHRVAHSKHCDCSGGAHLYFVRRVRTPRLYAATGGW